MDEALLDILACPLCKGKLVYDKPEQNLICRFDSLAYPIRQGIPVMLVDEATALNEEES
ncbi:MAG: Trm112 family protein [Coxiellaceae bacterium]|nr:Trm112 family protein [Coxiellaceae bacterium]